jgi:hypothetical protein
MTQDSDPRWGETRCAPATAVMDRRPAWPPSVAEQVVEIVGVLLFLPRFLSISGPAVRSASPIHRAPSNWLWLQALSPARPPGRG